MQALLNSLNIDEDYGPPSASRVESGYRNFDRSAESVRASYHETQDTPRDRSPPERNSRHFGVGSEVPDVLKRSQVPLQAFVPGRREQKTLDSRGGLYYADTDMTALGEVPKSTEGTQAHAGVSPKPHRKPVDRSSQQRSYFSPDDLDDLVRKQPSNVASFQSMSQKGPISRTATRSPEQYPAQPSYDIYAARNRYSSYAGQIPHPDNYSPGLVPTPAITEFASAAAPFSSHNPERTIRNNVNRSQDLISRPMTAYSENFSTSPLVHPAMLAQTPEFARIPSPPTSRKDSIPSSHNRVNQSMAPTRSNTQFAAPTQSPALSSFHPIPGPVRSMSALSNHSQMSSSSDVHPRLSNGPMRSMSSLSNHSHHSPDRERQYQSPFYGSEGYHGARIPSPDRFQQLPNHLHNLIESRSDTDSVPPMSQARRGRQKGELVVESDLPAMPALFVETDERRGMPKLPQPPAAYPLASPSRSPTRNSNILPHLTPRKKNSFVREPDLLQSVKVLPVRPIRCPPLCVEERFHPFPFVKTNKFKVKVYPSQNTFVAGGEVFGHMDIISDEGFRAQLGSTQVLVAEIGVEIIGYEEIQHPDSGHNARSLTFLYSRKVFQTAAETHPGRAVDEQILTNTVLHNPPPDKDGYRAASKGTTSFPFSFPMPVDAPSSADVHVARVQYLITGYATVKLQGSHEVIATSCPVRVVEAWDVHNPIYEEPIEAVQGRDIANYHEIAATASIPRSLYIEGETVCGSVRVANHTAKRVKEVKFLLLNRITFFGDKRSALRDLNPAEDFSLETSVYGHVEPHLISSGGEETWLFNIALPRDRCISIRNTALFEVTPCILIKISTGPLNKSTKLYIPPISIASPESMVDDHGRKAPTSELLKWSNLPNLFRYQRLNDGSLQPPEKGTFEVTDLITYLDAHQRVMLLSAES